MAECLKHHPPHGASPDAVMNSCTCRSWLEDVQARDADDWRWWMKFHTGWRQIEQDRRDLLRVVEALRHALDDAGCEWETPPDCAGRNVSAENRCVRCAALALCDPPTPPTTPEGHDG